MEKEKHEEVRQLLIGALQDAWDDHVSDTGCYPDFLEIDGDQATAIFSIGNFANDVAGRLTDANSNLLIKAKKIEWSDNGGGEWEETAYGFYIETDKDDGEYILTWGEDDSDRFTTLDAAKEDAQRRIDSYIRRHAVISAFDD